MINRSSYPSRSTGASTEPLTWPTFLRLWRSATDCPTVDDYIAEMGGEIADRAQVIPAMEAIYAMAWGDIQTVREASELICKDFADRYVLSLDTVKGWSAGRSAPSEALRVHLAYAVTNSIISPD